MSHVSYVSCVTSLICHEPCLSQEHSLWSKSSSIAHVNQNDRLEDSAQGHGDVEGDVEGGAGHPHSEAYLHLTTGSFARSFVKKRNSLLKGAGMGISMADLRRTSSSHSITRTGACTYTHTPMHTHTYIYAGMHACVLAIHTYET